jgi:hypothetical protein
VISWKQPSAPRLPPTQSYSEILREQAGVTCLRPTTPKVFASWEAWQARRRDRRRKEKEKLEVRIKKEDAR